MGKLIFMNEIVMGKPGQNHHNYTLDASQIFEHRSTLIVQGFKNEKIFGLKTLTKYLIKSFLFASLQV